MKPFFLLCIIALLISACSSTPQNEKNWPDDLPPLDFFKTYYKNDIKRQELTQQQDYLLWVKRFYLGWELYGKGWLEATNELVDTLDDSSDKKLAKKKALEIGQLVSAEWAKNKKHRVINTLHVSIWGNSLNRAIVEKQQLTMLDKIMLDAQDLLDSKIKPEDIKPNRYYTPKPFIVNLSRDF